MDQALGELRGVLCCGLHGTTHPLVGAHSIGLPLQTSVLLVSWQHIKISQSQIKHMHASVEPITHSLFGSGSGPNKTGPYSSHRDWNAPCTAWIAGPLYHQSQEGDKPRG